MAQSGDPSWNELIADTDAGKPVQILQHIFTATASTLILCCLRGCNRDLGDLPSLMATLDANGTGKISWLEFFAGVTSASFGARFKTFNEAALLRAPRKIFVQAAADVGMVKDALDSLGLMERLPYYFLSFRARRSYERGRVAPSARTPDVLVRRLSEAQLRGIDVAIGLALVVGVVAGALSAMAVVWCEPLAPGRARSASREGAFFAMQMLISTLEVMWIYYALCEASVEMARVCHLVLWPLDHERALITAALARAAFELPHPLSPGLGIDPMKAVAGWRLTLYQLCYMGKRGLTTFLLRLVLKKVLARALFRYALLGVLERLERRVSSR